MTKYLYISYDKLFSIPKKIYCIGDNMRTLKEVKPGETVTLVKYHESGDVDLRRHLLGMGFVKGAKITVKKVATLGNPIEMSVKGYDVCLRKEEAENIEVQ